MITHPLFGDVHRRCNHRDRPVVGNAGCGPCWEDAIVEAAAREEGVA